MTQTLASFPLTLAYASVVDKGQVGGRGVDVEDACHGLQCGDVLKRVAKEGEKSVTHRAFFPFLILDSFFPFSEGPVKLDSPDNSMQAYVELMCNVI